MTPLLNEIRRLPVSDRRLLVREILAGIEEDTRRDALQSNERYDHIMKTAQAVWGINDLKTKSRGAGYIWARAFVVKELTKEGCPVEDIARFIDRHRTTVIHLRNKAGLLDENPAYDLNAFQKYKMYKELL